MGGSSEKGNKQMITPDYLDNIIKGVENVVSENNEYLLQRIAKHIADSFNAGEDNIIMPSTIRDMHKLMDSGMVLDDIQKEVVKMLPSIRKEVRSAFLQSAGEISNYETDFTQKLVKTLNNHGQTIDVEIPDYEKVGLPKSTKDLHMTATEIRKLEQVYRSTMKRVNNYCNTMPSAGQTAYIDACNKAFMKAQAGVSPTQAICDAIDEMATAGIKVVNYDTGHQDNVEVAVARAVRSGINKANSEVVLTRCAELGVGHVKVSSHLGARVTGTEDYKDHSWWQGKIFRLNYDSEELKDYVPTEEEHQQNVNDGFGWMDTINSAVQNDAGFDEALLYSDEELFNKDLSEKIDNFKKSIDEFTKHKPIVYDDLKGEHKQNMDEIVNNAPELFRNVFNKFKRNVFFVHEKTLAVSRTRDINIYTNLNRDINDGYRATFHEIGHAIDNYNGKISILEMFKTTLKSDFERFAISFDKDYNDGDAIETTYAKVRMLLKNKNFRSVSDIIGGLTQNECVVYGHPDNYWLKRPNGVVKEAFAHFFSASIRNDEEELMAIKQVFPNAYDMFLDMVNELWKR